MLRTIILIGSLFVAFALAAPEGRIVGGSPAELGQFPHQILLKRGGRFTCGGSIIDENFVLTAAHCVVQAGGSSYPPEEFLVVAGSVEQDIDTVTRAVSKVTVHENYGNEGNDIALLELAEQLEFSDTVKPIELYSGEVPVDSEVVISGFGREVQGGPASPVLKYNTLTLVPASQCAKFSGIRKGLICLGHKKGNGACNGDSGGPALYNGKLVGVANFVVRKCGTGFPDGYASVSYFYDWIFKKINENKF